MSKNQNKERDLAIFDLGNVVFQVNWDPMFAIWSEASKVSIPDLKERWRFELAFERFERAHITPEEFAVAIGQMLQIDIPYLEFVRGWKAIYANEFDGIAKLLERLKACVPVVAFTNTNQLHTEVWPDRYQETLSHFSKIFQSHLMGVRKPEVEGFYTILSEFNVLPERTIFFDDFEPNVHAASQLGIQAVQVSSLNDISSALSKYLSTSR